MFKFYKESVLPNIGWIIIIAFIIFSWKHGFDTSEWFINSGGL